MFGKRILAAFIDYVLVSIALFVLCNFIILNINRDINSQALPFISFQTIISPFEVAQSIIEYPRSLGISLEQFCFLLIILFFCEVIIYTVFELSPLKRTVGKMCMSIKYNKNLTLKKALIRNSIKVLSRYLFGIPMVVMLFTKDKKTIHDLATGTVVVSQE